jgi:hypothetical protein
MSDTKRARTYTWVNPLKTAELGKTMSGYDFLHGILKGEIPPPPIATTLGLHPLSLEEGKVPMAYQLA